MRQRVCLGLAATAAWVVMLFAGTALAQSDQPPRFTILEGYDLPLSDYHSGMQDPLLRGIPLNECQQHCAADNSCRAFTYNATRRVCILKNAVPTRKALVGAVCGIKMEGYQFEILPDFDFPRRGALDGAEFAWGSELTPGGRHFANTWQGQFPYQSLVQDGYERTSPVTAFPPNGYGIYGTIGNVWEWTSEWWSARHQPDEPKPCCIPDSPRAGREETSYDLSLPNINIPRMVVKGDSDLCAPNYCRRYRPAARHAQPVDASMSHIGFRCVVRAGVAHEHKEKSRPNQSG